MSSKALKVGVFGCGLMGAQYAAALKRHPASELVCIGVASDRRKDELKSEFGIMPDVGLTPNQFLDEHDDLDALVIATPEWCHVDIATKAVSRKLNVLIEKPLASSLGDSMKISEAAELSDSVVMVCHSMRYDPRYIAMYEAVRSGRVGSVRQMFARRNADSAAFSRICGHCDPAYWLSVHDSDVMRWITNEEVLEVSARWMSQNRGTPEGLSVDLDFSDGIYGHIENSWVTPRLHGRPRNGFFDVLGDEGAVELNAWEQGLLVQHKDCPIQAPDTIYHLESEQKNYGVVTATVDNFLYSILGIEQPRATIQDALSSIRVAEAIRKSIASGAAVKLKCT